ncbi:MAG: right-handed parallel beta-helix repeat-containing protein [Desulfobacteraceae bacterium]|nr:right-handed parallel beta-helix repeat-containing protein [Desulfobacteraceae bacterium]
MKRITFMLLAVVLTLVIGIPTIPPTPVKAATVWEVNPGESIQVAVNGASDYDIIRITPGTYNQRIVVNKPLTVEGNGNGPVIIQGPALGNGYAVRVEYTEYVTISNLTTQYCRIGISLYQSTNITVIDNTSQNNTQHGIALEWWSNENTITGNTLTNNDDSGIFLELSNNNNISGNRIFENGDKPVPQAHGVYLKHSSNNNISGNEIYRNSAYGIELWGGATDDNTISENEIYENYQSGILASTNPWYTVITDNYIHDNDYSGIILTDNVRGNEVYYNDVESNGNWGIYARGAPDSRVYNNNFIDNHKVINPNAKQAYSRDSGNMVFNLDPLLDPLIGGNYWSDWTTPDSDSDGFVDNPYTIPGHPNPAYWAKDNLPWANENGWESSPNRPPVANAGGQNNQYTSAEGNFPNGITFDAIGSNDPDNDALEFRWDFEDDGTWDTDWSSDPTAYNWWRDDWEGNARVEVTDGQLTDSDTAEVIITNAAPSIDCMAITAVPGSAPVGQPIEVTAPFKDVGLDDTHDDSFFDWGDSSSSQAIISPGQYEADHWASGTHIYNSLGIYTITLHAIDDDEGEDTCTITVIVTGEDGCMRTIGFWKHQFGGKGSQHIDDGTLEIYLDIVDNKSKVFSEEVLSETLEDAENLLWLKKASIRGRATQQLLASWLNFANGAVKMGDMVDTNYDGIVDSLFEDAIRIAEGILRDPEASGTELEQAKDICDSINNMKTCE